MAVSDWLRPVPRSASYAFDVVDLEEISSAPMPAAFADLLRDAYFGKDYLATLADRYGFATVKSRLESRIPVQEPTQRGDFGEAVTVEILEALEGFHVPVNKLRYKIASNQILPGPDCLAFKLSEGELQEIAYAEVKLRTAPDKAVAVKGAKQLGRDAQTGGPALLTFVLLRLRNREEALADAIEAYVFGRSDSKDKFLLSILYEKAHWAEDILGRLEDEGIELKPLVVYVARIAQLKSLVAATYAELRAEAQGNGR